MHPVILSNIKDKEMAWKPVTYLSRLGEEAKVLDTKQLHRVRVSVMGMKLPSNA